MNDPTLPASPRRWPVWLVGAAALALVLFWLIPGRPSRPAPDEQVAKGSPGTTSSETCARILESLIDGLQPERFGISVDRPVLVDTLNNWRDECRATASAGTDDASLRERLLSPEARALLATERFTDPDAAHLRTSFLAKGFVDATLRGERTDLERAVALFYAVVRSTDLIPPGVDSVPMTPYESLLFGQGTAADRAWTFALLLRQLRLDAVILRERGATDEATPWLVGVILPGEGVYLFDPRLGLPISAVEVKNGEEVSPLPRTPLTLQQVREDPSSLRQYDRANDPYPWDVARLANVEVRAIGAPSTWAPRVGELQAQWPASVEVYDGLGATELRPVGLFERLVQAGAGGLWTEHDVGVWTYPETRLQAVSDLPESLQQEVQARASILQAPFTIRAFQPEEGGEVQVEFEAPARNLENARLRHLLGDHESALQVYLRSRLSVKQLPNGQPVGENIFAADLASFWVALAQYDQANYRVAAETAERYLRTPGPGTRVIPVMFLMALSLAEEGRRAEAAQVLRTLGPEAPQAAGFDWLIRRWGGDAPPPSTSEPSPPPAATPDAEGAPAVKGPDARPPAPPMAAPPEAAASSPDAGTAVDSGTTPTPHTPDRSSPTGDASAEPVRPLARPPAPPEPVRSPPPATSS
jgi:hypothetical protein